MVRKKKLIWWESEPAVTGTDQSRTRGSHDDSGPRRGARSPFYGPVTIARDDDDEGDDVEAVAG